MLYVDRITMGVSAGEADDASFITEDKKNEAPNVVASSKEGSSCGGEETEDDKQKSWLIDLWPI